MALLEYLLFKYSKDINACLEAPQDDNGEQVFYLFMIIIIIAQHYQRIFMTGTG